MEVCQLHEGVLGGSVTASKLLQYTVPAPLDIQKLGSQQPGCLRPQSAQLSVDLQVFLPSSKGSSGSHGNMAEYLTSLGGITSQWEGR